MSLGRVLGLAQLSHVIVHTTTSPGRVLQLLLDLVNVRQAIELDDTRLLERITVQINHILPVVHEHGLSHCLYVSVHKETSLSPEVSLSDSIGAVLGLGCML